MLSNTPLKRSAFAFLVTLLCTLHHSGVSTASDLPTHSNQKVARDDYFHLKTSETIHSWIADPSTGRVFGSLQNGNQVIEYGLAMKSIVRRFNVGNKCDRMLVRGNRLLVLGQEPTTLDIINLDTNENESRLSFSCNRLVDLTATQKRDSFVYVVGAQSERYGDCVIYKVDLDSKKVVQSIRGTPESRDYIVNAVISDQGSAFGFDRRGYLSPSGAFCATIDHTEQSFTFSANIHSSFAVMQAGPAERFWTLGPSLVSFDKMKTVRQFGGHMVTVHPTKDLAVSLDVVDKRIEFWQFSNGKKLGAVVLEELDNRIKPSTRRKSWYYDRDVDDPALIFDEKNKSVFCALRSTAFRIPYENLVGELKPQVLIKAPAINKAQVGEEIKLTLELTDPSLLSQAKFKIESGPEIIKLEGRTLSWKPGVQNIGDHQLLVSTEVNGVADQLTLNISVKGNEIDLGFPTQQWTVSPSGKFAVAWGVKPKDRNGSLRPDRDSENEIVVINLEQGKILNQVTNDKPVQAAGIDDRYVYIINRNSNVLHRHLIDDLSEKKRVFLPGTGIRLLNTTDSKLLVHHQSGNSISSSSMKQSIVDPDTLKTIQDDPRTGSVSSTSSYGYFQLENGELTDGRHIYDAKTGNVKVILQPNNTGMQIFDTNALRHFQSGYSSVAKAKRWGRSYDRTALRDGKDNQVCLIPSPFMISPDYPVGIRFETEQSRDGRVVTTTGQFKFYDLIEGAVLGTQPLFKSTETGRGFSRQYFSAGIIELIHCRGKVCHTIHDGKIYSAQIPDKVLEKAKSPLRILNPDSYKIDMTKPSVKLQFQTPGYQKVKYSLLTALKYVSLDENTGTMTIDTGKIWIEHLNGAVNPSSPFYRSRSRSQETQSNSRLVETNRRYHISEGQTGLLMPMAISATGDDGQSDLLQFCLIAIGDKTEIEKRKNLLAQQRTEQQQKMEKEQAARRAEIQKAREEAMQKAELDKSSELSKSAEIDALNRKIRRLEVLIDSLIDRIEKLESADK